MEEESRQHAKKRRAQAEKGIEERLVTIEQMFGEPIAITLVVSKGLITLRACATATEYEESEGGDDGEGLMFPEHKEFIHPLSAKSQYIG